MEDKKPLLNEDEIIIESKATLDRINTWIFQCDAKAGIILGILGVAFTLLISRDSIADYKNLFKLLLTYRAGVLLVISIVASLIIIMIGTGMLIFTLIPVTDSKFFNEPYINTKSKIHFDSISKYNSFKEYKEKFSHIRRQDYINDLISQVYINSSIASRKYKAYKTGVITSCIGFTVFLILSVIGYVIVN